MAVDPTRPPVRDFIQALNDSYDKEFIFNDILQVISEIEITMGLNSEQMILIFTMLGALFPVSIEAYGKEKIVASYKKYRETIVQVSRRTSKNLIIGALCATLFIALPEFTIECYGSTRETSTRVIAMVKEILEKHVHGKKLLFKLQTQPCKRGFTLFIENKGETILQSLTCTFSHRKKQHLDHLETEILERNFAS